LISSAAHAGCAFSAAATALLTSVASPAGKTPIFSLFAGVSHSVHLFASPAPISPPLSIFPFLLACSVLTILPRGPLPAALAWARSILYRGSQDWTRRPLVPPNPKFASPVPRVRLRTSGSKGH